MSHSDSYRINQAEHLPCLSPRNTAHSRSTNAVNSVRKCSGVMAAPAPFSPRTLVHYVVRHNVQRLNDLRGLQNMENNRLETAESAARPSIEAILAGIEKQIEVVRKQIKAHIDDHPDLKTQKELLLSILGMGDNTAAILLAFLSPLERFHSAKQLVVYAGLNPRIRQSGQWAGKTPIAKTGNACLSGCLTHILPVAC